jgi:hypothetical protein
LLIGMVGDPYTGGVRREPSGNFEYLPIHR